MNLRMMFVLLGLMAVTLPSQASVYEARVFIEAMVNGIEAKPTSCNGDVVEVTEMRGMAVVCAEYERSFESFQAAWQANMESSYASNDRYRTRRSEAKSRTDWEQGTGHYERIYAVGETIVGVRFTGGQLLFVYK